MFKQNEGILDRIVRVTLGIVLLPTGLLLGGLHGNVPGIVVAGVGAIGLATGLTGVCLLYIPFAISTLKKEKELIARCKSMMAGCRPGGYAGTGRMCGPDPQSIEKAS